MKPDKHKQKASARYRKKDEIPSNKTKVKKIEQKKKELQVVEDNRGVEKSQHEIESSFRKRGVHAQRETIGELPVPQEETVIGQTTEELLLQKGGHYKEKTNVSVKPSIISYVKIANYMNENIDSWDGFNSYDRMAFIYLHTNFHFNNVEADASLLPYSPFVESSQLRSSVDIPPNAVHPLASNLINRLFLYCEQESPGDSVTLKSAEDCYNACLEQDIFQSYSYVHLLDAISRRARTTSTTARMSRRPWVANRLSEQLKLAGETLEKEIFLSGKHKITDIVGSNEHVIKLIVYSSKIIRRFLAKEGNTKDFPANAIRFLAGYVAAAMCTAVPRPTYNRSLLAMPSDLDYITRCERYENSRYYSEALTPLEEDGDLYTEYQPSIQLGFNLSFMDFST